MKISDLFNKYFSKYKLLSRANQIAYLVIALATLINVFFGLLLALVYLFITTEKIPRKRKILYCTVLISSLAFIFSFSIYKHSTDEEPILEIIEPNETNISSKENSIFVKGTFFPESNYVHINGQSIPTNSGNFEYNVELKEGINEIKVSSGDWKSTSRTLLVTRIVEHTEDDTSAEYDESDVPTEQNISEMPFQEQESNTSDSNEQSFPEEQYTAEQTENLAEAQYRTQMRILNEDLSVVFASLEQLSDPYIANDYYEVEEILVHGIVEIQRIRDDFMQISAPDSFSEIHSLYSQAMDIWFFSLNDALLGLYEEDPSKIEKASEEILGATKLLEEANDKLQILNERNEF